MKCHLSAVTRTCGASSRSLALRLLSSRQIPRPLRLLTHFPAIDENRIHRAHRGRGVDGRCLGDEERFSLGFYKCPIERVIEPHYIRRFTKTEPVSSALTAIDPNVLDGLDQCDVRVDA
jgi:hypothetical protein